MANVRQVATIADVEELAVERILSLDGSRYNQGRRIKGVWKEAEEALIVEGEAHARGHLAFNVFAESGRNTGRQRDRHDESIQTRADLVVLFMFHIRAGAQVPDSREASRAARDVVAALLANPQTLVVFDVVNSWRPSVVSGGDWLLVRMDFSADFDLSLLERAPSLLT